MNSFLWQSAGCSQAQYLLAIWERSSRLPRQWNGQTGNAYFDPSSGDQIQVSMRPSIHSNSKTVHLVSCTVMNCLHGFKSLRSIGMQVGDSGTPRWDRVLPIPCAEAWPSCQVVESLRQLRSRRMTLLAASNPVSLASTLALSANPVKGEGEAPLCLIV